MEEDILAGIFFGVYIFLNFLHTCMLTIFIMKLQKNSFVNGKMMNGDANPYYIGDLTNRVSSAETLAPMAEDYEDPIKHQEPNYAELDLEKTEKYDALNYLQQNTKKHLSYDKLRILAEEIRRD